MENDKTLKLLQDAFAYIKEDNDDLADEIDLQSTLGELGIDSIRALEMISHIEDQVDVQFPDDELSSITTVRDFYDLINHKLHNVSLLQAEEA